MSRSVGVVRFWSLAVGQAPPYIFLLWVSPYGGERLAFGFVSRGGYFVVGHEWPTYAGYWFCIGCRIMGAIAFSSLFRSFRRACGDVADTHAGFWTSDNGACGTQPIAWLLRKFFPQHPRSQAVGVVRFWSLAVGQAPPYIFLLRVSPCGGERLAFWLCFAKRVFCCRP